mgnify:CR=1 FL=1
MTLKIVNLEQGTSAWKDWRNSGIGASDLPVIMGVSPYSTPEKLWEAKRSGIDTFAGNWATERGQRLEPAARALAEQSLAAMGCVVKLEPVCFEDEQHPWMHASLDGFAIDETIMPERIGVELKCLGEKAHLEAVNNGRVPGHYMPQLVWQAMVADLDRVFIGFYNPDIEDAGKRFVLLEVDLDGQYVKQVMDAGRAFWKSLRESVNPYSGDGAPAGWEEAAAAYRAAKAVADDAAAAADEAKKKLLDMAAGRDVKACGVSVSRIETRGSIDWAKAQKENPDIAQKAEEYRKPSTFSFRVNIEKGEI